MGLLTPEQVDRVGKVEGARERKVNGGIRVDIRSMAYL